MRRQALWAETSLPRLKKCGRIRRADLVGVRGGPSGAGLAGLCTCGSPWACPVCNAKIMARRALDLGLGIAGWQGRDGGVIFTTFTLRHRKGQSLAALWTGLLAAWRLMTKGAPWDRYRDRLGLLGWVRVVEVTRGVHGWHVHIHALLFVRGDVTADDVAEFGAWSAARWSSMVVRQGLAAPLAVGQDARLVLGPGDFDLSEYLAKQTDRRDAATSMGLELTASQSKRARAGHKTKPVWDLLTRVLEHGDARALDLWHEWEAGSHGRRQMTWSKGLRRELLGMADDLTDDEIVAAQPGDEDLVWITAEGWDNLVANDARLQVAILDAAERSPADLRRLLIRHGVPFLDPQAPEGIPSAPRDVAGLALAGVGEPAQAERPAPPAPRVPDDSDLGDPA